MLQIIAQVLAGLRDDSKKNWALSELFSQVFFIPVDDFTGRKGTILFFTPFFSANHLAWPISL